MNPIINKLWMKVVTILAFLGVSILLHVYTLGRFIYSTDISQSLKGLSFLGILFISLFIVGWFRVQNSESARKILYILAIMGVLLIVVIIILGAMGLSPVGTPLRTPL